MLHNRFPPYFIILLTCSQVPRWHGAKDVVPAHIHQWPVNKTDQRLFFFLRFLSCLSKFQVHKRLHTMFLVAFSLSFCSTTGRTCRSIEMKRHQLDGRPIRPVVKVSCKRITSDTFCCRGHRNTKKVCHFHCVKFKNDVYFARSSRVFMAAVRFALLSHSCRPPWFYLHCHTRSPTISTLLSA